MRIRQLPPLPAALPKSLPRLPLPAALLKSLPRLPLPAALLKSLPRLPPPAALLRRSKTSFHPKAVPGGRNICREHCELHGKSDQHRLLYSKVNLMKQFFSFQWHITDECDQRCKHCYIFSGDPCRKLDSMTWEQMQDTFYNCLDFCEVYGRLPYFYLTGGDPILHPDFWRLLELFHEHDVPFTIMGNPFHLNDRVCRELKYYGCQKYQLSLDGLRETHDWFRKPGSYECTLEKIGCINRAGIRSVIMTTVSKQNYMEVPGIIDAVVKAGANIFAFSRYVPSGGELDTSMTPQEYRGLLAMCDRKFKEYEAEGCDTYFNKKDHLWTLYEYETGAFKIPAYACDGMIYGGCNCGNCHITILPTGDIYACRRVADSKVGNIFEDRLADIWITSMEAYRNYDEFSKCSRCKLKQFCRGCPAVAKGYTGDFYGDDPQCWASEENGLLTPKTEVQKNESRSA